MSAEKRTLPRTLSCLVKGPLGCLTFLLGAALVFVLFLPPAGGRLARGWTEEWFDEYHHGTLELGESWIGSLYGPQRIESLVLRDPDDEEVLRGSVHAPSLEHLFGDPESYGPIVLDIASLRLTLDADGRTNLARALARRAPAEPEDAAYGRRGGFTTDRPIPIALEVRIERVRFETPGGDEGTLERVVLAGELTLGPYQRHLRLAGGVPAAEGAATGPELELRISQAAPDVPWTTELELRHAPAALVAVVCRVLAPLSRRAGPVVDEAGTTSGGGELTAHLADEGASFHASGRIDGDVLGSAQLDLWIPCDSPRADGLVELLPFLAAVECENGGGTHVLRLAQARWPLDAGAEAASGELFLELAPSRGTLAPALQPLAAGVDDARVFLGGEARHVRVEDGALVFADFPLPLEHGRLVIEGLHAPVAGTTELAVAGEIAGAPLAPLELVARDGVLVPAAAAPEPPPVPAVPAAPEHPLPVPERDTDRDEEG
jgi:hypothetical protein